MKAWRTRSRRTILDRSPWFAVESHVVELPDGSVIEDWPWLVGREFVNVVAVTADGRFVLLRQVKYAVDGTSLAPVGGYLEEGEDPLPAAQRELLEETGYEADEWSFLGRYVVDGNRGAGVGHLFLARGARKVAEPDADDLEEQELVTLDRGEVETALLAGELKVMSWATAVGLALARLEADRTGGRLYVLVSGPPGSGKSTLAPPIAERLDLPLIAKDTIKDALMSVMPPGNVQESQRLGRASVAAMFAVAAEAPRGAVLESVFYRSRALDDVRGLPGRVVEVFCRCDSDVAVARYRARAGARSAGHFDHIRTPDELRNPEVTEPVAGGWPVLEVDTSEPVDVLEVLADVEAVRSAGA